MKLTILTGLLLAIIGVAICVPADLDYGGIEPTEDSASKLIYKVRHQISKLTLY